MFNQTPKKITSLQNPVIKHLVHLRQNKHYREEQKAVLVSGYKLIQEISKLHTPSKLFIAKLEDKLTAQETYLVTPEILKKITNLPSPEPIVAEFPLPNSSSLQKQAPLLVLDAIQDPGNLGTLIRTALGLNWQGVFFLPNCVDPFHEKVLRASRGALFYLPWKMGTYKELEALKQENHLTSYIADMEGTPLSKISPQKNTLLILSNEAEGVSSQAESFGTKVAVPIQSIESLNVAIAGALLMYHLGGP
ncbi:MAG: 23S rRNA (guanosine-2'-O-)-methyltransferase RlmB [Chlamydiales bacterium]|nr:23S rRNA (guanosine-2'-O-)-methyltransferase RlmB [Chlamydiales bacterium]